MPYSPLVSKIRVHNPNKKGSSSANRNYVTYIATREGVSLEHVDDINDLLRTDQIMDKSLNDEIVHQEANNKEYIEYMARRPRSQGLFGNIDTSDLKEVSSQVASLTQSGRVIYRGIISLGEKDGEALGFRNINAWNNYLKQVMPDIAQNLGISSYDHTWVAAFHAEESHPHVHYMLWDNQDRVKSPFIHKATQQKIRIFLENQMFDDAYERSVKMALAPELEEQNKIRNQERSSILKETEKVLESTFTLGVEYEKLPTRASNSYLRQIAAETEKLIGLLPGDGAFKYKYLPPDAKVQLNKIVDLLLEKQDIRASMDKYLNSVRTTQKLKGRTSTKINSELEKEETELRKRIANRVLKEIKPILLAGRQSDVAIEQAEEKAIQKIEIGSYQGNNMYDSLNNIVGEKYYLDWNEPYKEAMELLYGAETDVQKAFNILEEEAIAGNTLAIFESGKLIDRNLLQYIDEQEAQEYYHESHLAFEKIYSKEEDDYKKQYAAYRVGKLNVAGLGMSDADYHEAEKWLKRASENKYAQYSLGKIYLEDKVYVSELQDSLENKKEALKLFISSAEKKNPFASYELGKMYMRGIGTEINAQKAQSHYQNALEQFKKMAKKSTDDSLLYRLGRMYIDGLGTEVDTNEGEKYIYKAAKLGNEAAKLTLATLYLKEDNDILHKRAIGMLEEMAEKGSGMAQYKLGAIYANPDLPEYYNLEKAIGYLEASAEQGNEFAQYKLGAIYANPDFPEHYNLEKAVRYLEEAAEQGNEFAQYKLGAVYTNPDNQGHFNMEKGMSYLEVSAEQGNQYAQYKLGAIYADENRPLFYDLDKAIEYLGKSAVQENQFAQYKLGMIYANAENTDYYNLYRAVDYLHKSAIQGNQYAQSRLGVIYYFGKDEIPQDKDLGKYWLEKAAEQGDQFAKDVLENDGLIGINFSYCLLKGTLASLETLNRQMNYSNEELARTQSRQAAREKYLHRDNEQGTEDNI